MHAAANLLALLVLPIVLVGVINRIKARWAGRKGAPVLQLAFDLRRLARKRSVYGEVTTPVFRLAPVVVLVTALGSAAIVPLVGWPPLVSFRLDFVWLFYLWGLGRVALVLGALDTGSSFEGMGAAREATLGTLVEPVLFLVIGALGLATGGHTLAGALALSTQGHAALAVQVAVVVALVIVLQVEAARIPVDDPTTHLELTMIHEVMVLDHSGRELAMLQLAGALKLFVVTAIIATILNPWAGVADWRAPAVNLVLTGAVAAAVALIESLVARLELRVLPHYLAIALAAGGVALLAILAGGT